MALRATAGNGNIGIDNGNGSFGRDGGTGGSFNTGAWNGNDAFTNRGVAGSFNIGTWNTGVGNIGFDGRLTSSISEREAPGVRLNGVGMTGAY